MNRKQFKIIIAIIFLMYIAFLLWKTLLGRTPMDDRNAKLELFWTYKLLFSGKKRGKRLVIQNLLNIVAFIPYGFLLPEIIGGNNRRRCFIAVFSALLLSAAIEGCQWLFRLGMFEFDDIICNTLGALIGSGLYMVLWHIIQKKTGSIL